MHRMKTKYAIHPDFAKFPVITLSFGVIVLALINTLSKVQRYFVRRALEVKVEAHHFTRADGSSCKVLTMHPEGLANPAPALLYYHGGGFGITYAGLHLKNCQRYAQEAGCVVVFVEYRLAPKQPFPDGFNDCYQTLEWALGQAQSLGIDTSRIAVGGDSAGGALAAGVAQRARDEQLVKLCGQLLIYPVMDNSCSTPSATDFDDVPVWNSRSNRHMWRMYLSRYADVEAPPYAAPGHGQFQNLPLSYVETAEFDPLRDEGKKHAQDLQANGVQVVVNDTLQTVHGYDAMEASELTQQGVRERIAFLRQAFA